MDGQQLLTPSEAAAVSGLGQKRLAQLADIGQVQVQRTAGGHRRYRPADMRRLATPPRRRR